MRSIRQQIELIEGLLGTDDVSDWEQSFIESVARHKSDTSKLSERQVEIIERIHDKHFA